MQPEHYDFANPLFLPVAAQTCQGLLERQDSSVLAGLSQAELAAVLVIQHLASTVGEPLNVGAAERILAKLLAWSNAGGDLAAEAKRLYQPVKFEAGLARVSDLPLRFLSAEDVAAADYLKEDGTWDSAFKARHYLRLNPFSQHMISRGKERWLTCEQDKLLRVFKANLDEDLHVQGYAGIGKSYLLSSLLDYLPRSRVLPLARTQSKLATLRARMGVAADKPFGKTFAELFRIAPGESRYRPATVSYRQQRKDELAVTLNVLGFRDFSGEKTLDICLGIVKCYCESRSRTLSSRHLPVFQQPLSDLEGRVLLEYASRLWSYLQANPESSVAMHFQALWWIKRANLEGYVIPSHYSHIVVDESQDIPASLLQIIERGRQVLITLGDEYQKASGDVVKRKRQVRQRDIAFSVRSGPAVERSVNSLICSHSHKSKIAFEGARSADVSVEFYPENFVPPHGCVILTASPWDTMRWAMVYSESGFIAFPETVDNGYSADEQHFQDIKGFMRSAVKLFRPDLYRASDDKGHGLHPYFVDMASWEQVRQANRFDESFLWIEARLHKGFFIGDLLPLEAKVRNHPASYLLMMAQDAGGMEFDQVMLTTELMSLNTFRDAYEFDRRICEVYIALSRARRRLYLPYDVEQWSDYHRTRPYREAHGH